MKEETKINIYNPSAEERQAIIDVYEKMQFCDDVRAAQYKYFDDQTLGQYINESVRRVNCNTPDRDIKDWQSNIAMPETRNKELAILSFVASQRPRVEISARTERNILDKKLSSVLSGLYDYSMEQDDGDFKFILSSFEALTKGTCYVKEGYDYDIRQVKTVIEQNWTTGEIKYTKEDRVEADNCASNIIPLEDVYIPNFYEMDEQKLPYIIVRELIDTETCRARYEDYPNYKYIRTASQMFDEDKEDNEFYEIWGTRLSKERNGDKLIEILHYYHKRDDLHLICANGVLLTPIDNPIIFDHKQYPLVKGMFEIMGIDFGYGKSLAQKLMNEQDAIDTLYNMMLDKTFLSMMPFWFTSLQDEIETDEIAPLARIQVTDVTQMREAQIPGITSADIEMMQTIRDSVSKSSVDPTQQGQVSGETATAVLRAKETSVLLLSLFTNLMARMITRQAKQRLANLLQFYPKQNKLKSDKLTNKDYKEIVLNKQTLDDGNTGIKIIRMVDDKSKFPKDEELQAERDKIKEDTGDTADIYYFTPNMLQNIDWTIRVVPNSSLPETKSLKKALMLEFINTIQSNPLFAQMANWEKVYDYLLELFDMNAEQMKKPPEPPQPPPQPGQPGQPMPPQGENSELVQQMAGTRQPSLKETLNMPTQ